MSVAVRWVDPLSADPLLARVGEIVAHDSEEVMSVAPANVWDPDQRGLPRSFPARTNQEIDGVLRVERGVLDGHQWFLDRDSTVFTSDMSFRPRAAPKMDTDLDTSLCSLGDRHELRDQDKPIAQLIGGSVCVSAEPSNWGSFLLRALPKLVRATATPGPVLAYLRHPNQVLLAELAGLSRDRLVFQDPGTRYALNDVQIDLLPTSDLWVSPTLKELFLELVKRARQRQPTRDAQPLVYLSRAGSLGRLGARALANEGEVATRLAALGFVVVAPEDLTADALAVLVNDARMVVAPGGAGMFNTVFADPGTVVIDIEAEPNWLYGHTNVLMGAVERWSLFYGTPVDPNEPRVHRPFRVDVDALVDAVRQEMSML